MSSVALSPLAQSADKSILFARLGLNEQVHKLLLVSHWGEKSPTSADPAVMSRGKLNLQETD